MTRIAFNDVILYLIVILPIHRSRWFQRSKCYFVLITCFNFNRNFSWGKISSSVAVVQQKMGRKIGEGPATTVVRQGTDWCRLIFWRGTPQGASVINIFQVRSDVYAIVYVLFGLC